MALIYLARCKLFTDFDMDPHNDNQVLAAFDHRIGLDLSEIEAAHKLLKQ